MADFPGTDFACPRCRSPLEQSESVELYCLVDGLDFPSRDGIWRMLLPERERFFSQFMKDYETIRRAEGRGSDESAFYRSLPYLDSNGIISHDWRIRASSYEALIKHVIRPIELQTGVSQRVIDLGAGNSWLSNRLAQRGHRVAAVDILTNDFDGLACRKYYEAEFSSIQAEFDRLPFVNRCADIIIFNASLHYSIDYKITLAEAQRVMADSGVFVILDSPVYHDADSGMRMVKERESEFRQKYGLASDALPSQNYLSYRGLEQLAEALHIHWRMITPKYGLRWRLRPWLASLSGRREPAKFHLIIGRKSNF